VQELINLALATRMYALPYTVFPPIRFVKHVRVQPGRQSDHCLERTVQDQVAQAEVSTSLAAPANDHPPTMRTIPRKFKPATTSTFVDSTVPRPVQPTHGFTLLTEIETEIDRTSFR